MDRGVLVIMKISGVVLVLMGSMLRCEYYENTENTDMEFLNVLVTKSPIPKSIVVSLVHDLEFHIVLLSPILHHSRRWVYDNQSYPFLECQTLQTPRKLRLSLSVFRWVWFSTHPCNKRIPLF